jgi:hypothetical protein
LHSIFSVTNLSFSGQIEAVNPRKTAVNIFQTVFDDALVGALRLILMNLTEQNWQ